MYVPFVAMRGAKEGGIAERVRERGEKAFGYSRKSDSAIKWERE